MPAGGKIGNKGGGRKSVRDERLRNLVIEKAWKMKEEKMSETDAIQIVVKDMASKLANADGSKLIPSPILGGVTQKINDNEKK